MPWLGGLCTPHTRISVSLPSSHPVTFRGVRVSRLRRLSRGTAHRSAALHLPRRRLRVNGVCRNLRDNAFRRKRFYPRLSHGQPLFEFLRTVVVVVTRWVSNVNRLRSLVSGGRETWKSSSSSSRSCMPTPHPERKTR